MGSCLSKSPTPTAVHPVVPYPAATPVGTTSTDSGSGKLDKPKPTGGPRDNAGGAGKASTALDDRASGADSLVPKSSGATQELSPPPVLSGRVAPPPHGSPSRAASDDMLTKAGATPMRHSSVGGSSSRRDSWKRVLRHEGPDALAKSKLVDIDREMQRIEDEHRVTKNGRVVQLTKERWQLLRRVQATRKGESASLLVRSHTASGTKIGALTTRPSFAALVPLAARTAKGSSTGGPAAGHQSSVRSVSSAPPNAGDGDGAAAGGGAAGIDDAAAGASSGAGDATGGNDEDDDDGAAEMDEMMSLDPSELLRRGYGASEVTNSLIVQHIRSAECTASEVQEAFRSTMAAHRTMEFYVLIGETLIQKGEPLMAEEVLYQGTKDHKDRKAVRLRQLHGLALAQGGSTERAIKTLEALREEGEMDDESGGLLARCYKDLAARERNEENKVHLLEKAFEIYKDAYERGGRSSYYTGINSATMAFLTGRTMEATALADEVLRLCQAEMKTWSNPSMPSANKGAYWVLATMGEAFVISGELASAMRLYTQARECAPRDFVKLASTQRQLRLLLRHKIRTGLNPQTLAGIVQGSARPRRASSTDVSFVLRAMARAASPSRMGAEDDSALIERHGGPTAEEIADHEALLLARGGPFQCMMDLPTVVVLLCSEMHAGLVVAGGVEQRLRDQARACLEATRSHFVYASPSSLVDIIFLEEAKRRGAELYIVLPVPLDVHLRWCASRFIEEEEYVDVTSNLGDITSPANAGRRLQGEGEHDEAEAAEAGTGAHGAAARAARRSLMFSTSNLIQRLRAVLATAARLDVANDMSPEMTITNRHYCSLFVDGLARKRAQLLGTAVERVYMHGTLLARGVSAEAMYERRPLEGEMVKDDGTTASGVNVLGNPTDIANTATSASVRANAAGGSRVGTAGLSARRSITNHGPPLSTFLFASGLFPDEVDPDEEEDGADDASAEQSPASPSAAATWRGANLATRNRKHAPSPVSPAQVLGYISPGPSEAATFTRPRGSAQPPTSKAGSSVFDLSPTSTRREMGGASTAGAASAGITPFAGSRQDLRMTAAARGAASSMPAGPPGTTMSPFAAAVGSPGIGLTVASLTSRRNSFAGLVSWRMGIRKRRIARFGVHVQPSSLAPRPEAKKRSLGAFRPSRGSKVSEGAADSPANHPPAMLRHTSEGSGRGVRVLSAGARAEMDTDVDPLTGESVSTSHGAAAFQTPKLQTGALANVPDAGRLGLVAPPLAVELWSSHGTPFRVLTCALCVKGGPRYASQLPMDDLRDVEILEPRAAHPSRAAGDPHAMDAELLDDLVDGTSTAAHEAGSAGTGGAAAADGTMSPTQAVAAALARARAAADGGAAAGKGRSAALSAGGASKLMAVIGEATVRSAFNSELSMTMESLVPAFQRKLAASQQADAKANAAAAAAGLVSSGSSSLMSPLSPTPPYGESSFTSVERPLPRRQVIAAILFADVVGYSKLGEQQVLVFIENVLGAMANLIDMLPKRCRPRIQQSWGDALYGVWARVPDAGEFALMLSDLITGVPWHTLGLPSNLNIRISLHAAPVHVVVDPILRLRNYTGVHTSRAARIEPITPPGSVYCTQAFAAISEMLNVQTYDCTYVGNVPLAKAYGMQPVYAVRWQGSVSSAPKLIRSKLQARLKAKAAMIKSRLHPSGASGGGGASGEVHH